MEKEVVCPYCHEVVTEEEKPSLSYTPMREGMFYRYVCSKKICRNTERHHGQGEIIIPYSGEYSIVKEKEVKR